METDDHTEIEKNDVIKDIEGYTREEITIDAAEAQVKAFYYFIPFLIAFGLPYILLWRENFTEANFLAAFSSGFKMVALLIGYFFGGVVVHELIHGITWSFFAKSGFRSIRFGILWKAATPYCHCNEPLLVKHYLIGGLMPGIIMGILPLIYALITGSLGWLAFGMFFTMAAGGDLMIAKMLLKIDLNMLVQDHPSKIGCVLYRPIDNYTLKD